MLLYRVEALSGRGKEWLSSSAQLSEPFRESEWELKEPYRHKRDDDDGGRDEEAEKGEKGQSKGYAGGYFDHGVSCW